MSCSFDYQIIVSISPLQHRINNEYHKERHYPWKHSEVLALAFLQEKSKCFNVP